MAEARVEMYLYLLQRVYKKTVFKDPQDINSDDSYAAQFNPLDFNKVRATLTEKYQQYYDESKNFPEEEEVCGEARESFRRKVKRIPYKKYGLNAKGKAQGGIEQPILPLDLPKEMEEFMSLARDAEQDTLSENPSAEKSAAPKYPSIQSKEELLAKASAVKQTHDRFPEILSTSVNGFLSNYAHSSQSSFVKLQKRNAKNRDRYLLNEADAEFKSEAERAEARLFARNAYQTAKEEYLRESRVRTVAVSNIEEPFQYLEQEADRIENSVQRLSRSAGIAGLILACAYIPFLIQWRSIFENLFSLGVAALSVAVPFIILFSVFGRLVQKEKMRYTELYRNYLQAVKQAVDDNQGSWQGYVRVFSDKIPALRYLYEYKTDVEAAYAEYDADKNKCRHHREHLERCMNAVETILIHLGANPTLKKDRTSREVEYEKVFSQGAGNEKIYTILNEKEIDEF
ncbi:MAG: hypothetical protein IKD07_03405 [Clostridia bacterium]|nr:hypothetical protein [Clostridia bacterium]